MSETSTLISYSGKTTRTDLAQVRTPPATPTHIPIPHIEVVETLVETLNLRHIGVVGEEFAVSSDGMEMSAVLDLETTFDGCRFRSEWQAQHLNATHEAVTSVKVSSARFTAHCHRGLLHVGTKIA